MIAIRITKSGRSRSSSGCLERKIFTTDQIKMVTSEGEVVFNGRKTKNQHESNGLVKKEKNTTNL